MTENPAILNKLKICNFNELNNLFYARMPKEACYETARWLVAQEGILTHLESERIYFFNQAKGIYEKKGRSRIKEILTKRFKHYATKHIQTEIINHIANITLHEEKEFEKNTPKNKIPVKNGLVNLETGKLENYHKNYWYSHQIPVNYDPSAKCDKIEEFFLQLVEEKDLPRLYDLFGLAIYHGYILEKFYILEGDGANGKSKFLKLLERFVGEENTSTVSLKQLTEDPFAIANTHNKLVNYGADIGSRPIYDTSVLKNFTGGERLTAQFKNKQHFDMLPTALLIFASNKPPSFADDSDGMYRRPEIIHFPFKFGNRADMEENPAIKPADPQILMKLTEEEELSGLFNKALLHLQKIIRTGELSVQKSTNELRKQYLRISNSVYAFVNEMCEPAEYRPANKEGQIFIEAEGCISNEEFYREYSAWCSQEGLKAEVPDWIGRRLKALQNWYLEIGNKDHYVFWGNLKKSIRGMKFRKPTKPPKEQETHQTHQTTIIEPIGLVKGNKEGFSEFGEFVMPDYYGVLSSINPPNQTHQINDSGDVLKFLQAKEAPVPFQELLEACPHKNAQEFLLEILSYYQKRGDVYQPRRDYWGVV